MRWQRKNKETHTKLAIHNTVKRLCDMHQTKTGGELVCMLKTRLCLSMATIQASDLKEDIIMHKVNPDDKKTIIIKHK